MCALCICRTIFGVQRKSEKKWISSRPEVRRGWGRPHRVSGRTRERQEGMLAEKSNWGKILNFLICLQTCKLRTQILPEFTTCRILQMWPVFIHWVLISPSPSVSCFFLQFQFDQTTAESTTFQFAPFASRKEMKTSNKFVLQNILFSIFYSFQCSNLECEPV